MNMPMRGRARTHPFVRDETSALMDRDGAADLAPDFDTVFSRRDASDVDARSARALDDVLHGTLQRSVLHEVNASIPCNGGLKHHETSGGREPFDLCNVCATRCSPGITNQTIQAVDTAIKAAPLNDGPASKQAGGGPIKQRKEVGNCLLYTSPSPRDCT